MKLKFSRQIFEKKIAQISKLTNNLPVGGGGGDFFHGDSKT
jgi:hypothetical protein